MGDVRYADAPHGYIAGVYLHPDRLDDAVTVWMRIERHSSTYIQVRWSRGILLVEGDSEEARVARANHVWSNLRENEPLTVTTYAERLFGKTPRCVAYIRARGSEENQDRGLLALGQRPFRPKDLATQVITLAGKLQAVENERKFRQDLDASESQLASKKADHQFQYQREEQELRDIGARRTSRKLLQNAAESWQLYLTLGTLVANSNSEDLAHKITKLESDINDKKQEIANAEGELSNLPSREDLFRELDNARKTHGAAERAKEDLLKESGSIATKLTGCEEKIRNLRKAAALAPGLSVPDAELKLDEARRAGRTADRQAERVQESIENAGLRFEELRAGRGGPAGPALSALGAEHIAAVSVIDVVTLDDDARAHWEARLSPYANAVVVARADHQRARAVLADHPGTPLLVVGDKENLVTAKAQPGEDGILTRFLQELERRTRADGPDWITDPGLALEIPGGYDIPLTDRQAAVQAVEKELAGLKAELEVAEQAQREAEERLTTATNQLTAAKATVELAVAEAELDALQSRERELAGLVDEAKERESSAADVSRDADDKYKNVDKERRELGAKIRQLRSDQTGCLGELLERVAVVREQGRIQKGVVDRWRQAAELADLRRASLDIANAAITLDDSTRDAYFHEARSVLRQAIEAVLGNTSDSLRVAGPSADSVPAGSDELHAGLNSRLHTLHKWCDDSRALTESVRPFDGVSRPLRAWLDWYGVEDDVREEQILANRKKNEREIEAAETQTAETRRWINSLRDNQIAIITQSFRDIESKLNELLAAVHRDPVSLRPRYSDLNDTSQPLRWELHPQWLPPGAKPVEYSNPPNTAELIILHTLLATASLVAATSPQGRMLILDESGNNLDGPNLTRVSAVLQQVAKRYGLTVVLACQDLYTDRVARHGAAMIQLLRPSPRDPLNAPPAVSHGDEEAAVLEAFLPYLNLGRPEGTATSVEGSPYSGTPRRGDDVAVR
ncbi:hypothetical protein ACFFMM_11325 [Micromonospora chaiyaphumensis]|uniref:hypothetical protein n=1 Tax=Micromonospora chaiyaphumensis TaxID=307119 RepID=UPI0011131E20|nr:hypothetical protein [Micromonospora chaiyaphumensis]